MNNEAEASGTTGPCQVTGLPGSVASPPDRMGTFVVRKPKTLLFVVAFAPKLLHVDFGPSFLLSILLHKSCTVASMIACHLSFRSRP